MKVLKRLALVLVGAAAVGCAPAQPEPVSYDHGVEVVNYTGQPLAISYQLRGAAEPEYLGSVAPRSTERFMLPRQVVSHVFATRPGGERVNSSNAVSIRRFRSDTPAN